MYFTSPCTVVCRAIRKKNFGYIVSLLLPFVYYVINPASIRLNDVILSSAKNFAFPCCYEKSFPPRRILWGEHGACPELKDEIHRCAQNDMRRAQNDTL